MAILFGFALESVARVFAFYQVLKVIAYTCITYEQEIEGPSFEQKPSLSPSSIRVSSTSGRLPVSSLPWTRRTPSVCSRAPRCSAA